MNNLIDKLYVIKDCIHRARAKLNKKEERINKVLDKIRNENPLLSCNNYYCIGYKENLCERAIEHRLKLYEKRLDDNQIKHDSSTELCNEYIERIKK